MCAHPHVNFPLCVMLISVHVQSFCFQVTNFYKIHKPLVLASGRTKIIGMPVSISKLNPTPTKPIKLTPSLIKLLWVKLGSLCKARFDLKVINTHADGSPYNAHTSVAALISILTQKTKYRSAYKGGNHKVIIL